MPAVPAARPVYSLVIPIYNEEAVLPILLRRLDELLPRMDGPAEVILVDDGSTDTCGVVAAARARDDARYRYLALSRNFGHQIAISAGLDAAAGDAVIVMDADLQDPPEVALELAAKWREGYEIVCAQRVNRDSDGRLKRWTANLFYKTIRRLTPVDIPDNVGDFRLIDRKALDTFRAMPERDRFVRGMFAWMGFRHTAVPFRRLARPAGRTKYSWAKMLRFAFDGIMGFSDLPLRMVLWTGCIVSTGAVLFGGYVLALAIADANLVRGWASTIVVLSFLSGVNLIMTGVVGLYVGRIHAEVKNRPLYVVARSVGFGRAPSVVRAPPQPLAATAAR